MGSKSSRQISVLRTRAEMVHILLRWGCPFRNRMDRVPCLVWSSHRVPRLKLLAQHTTEPFLAAVLTTLKGRPSYVVPSETGSDVTATSCQEGLRVHPPIFL